MVLTMEQRKALKRVYDRHDIPIKHDWQDGGTTAYRRMTYREFRKTVVGMIGSDPGIMVPWCGMWLGIETDGHTHS